MSRTAQWATLLVVLLLIVSMVVVLLVLTSFGSSSVASWSREKVLYVRMEGAIPEQKSADPFTELFSRESIDFRDLLDGLERASEDDRIEGALLEIRDVVLGWAQLEELRAALNSFRSQDKWVVTYFDSNGIFGLGGGNGSYYVAAATDEIVLAPPGEIGITGLRAETPFIRGMLEKLQIEPEFGQRKEFKNAVNTFTERNYTKPHREALEALLDSIYEEYVSGIASGRPDMNREKVKQLIDGGPYTSEEALELKLIDRRAYRDEIVDELRLRVGQEDPFIGLHRYLKGGRPHDSGSNKIALIYGVGTIVPGRSTEDMLAGSLMGSDTIVAAFKRAREDDGIKAVVFRVDSPGGSYIASDLIRRAVRLTRDANKPVVVSMGNLAASGGYFVSMQSDRIFANENTITGSIGVYAGKMVTRDFWREKVGINFAALQRGANAEFMSSQEGWDERATERMNRLLDNIYEDFVAKAADGRGMAEDELEPLAHGRVWTGRDALERGLVDEIGGIGDALEEAREMAGIEPGARFRVVVLPPRRGFFETFVERNEELRALPAGVREMLGIVDEIASGDARERLLLDRSLPRIR